MRGTQLGTRSSGVLISVVFTSTIFFFGAVGRYTTLHSQQTEGAVGFFARHSVNCCCLKNRIKHLKLRKARRNRTSNVNSSVIVPITNGDAHIYAAVKLQQNMRNAIQKKLNDKKNSSNTASIDSLTNTVDAIQRNSSNNRNSYVKKIKKRHTARRSSLQAKVEARNLARQKAKHSNALTNSKIFSDVDTKSIAEITDQMEYEMYQDKNVICKKGDEAKHLFLIVSGTCVVTIAGKEISRMHELEVFGESALFPSKNGLAIRSATVTSVGIVQLLSLSKEHFDALVESNTLNENCMKKLRQVLKDHEDADLKKRKVDNGDSSEIKVSKAIVKKKVIDDTEIKVNEPKKKVKENTEIKVSATRSESSARNHVEECRLVIADMIKDSIRLRTIFTKFSKSQENMNVLDRDKFEMVVSKAIAKKKKSNGLIYDKEKIWKAANDGKEMTSIEFVQLEKWLGF